MMLEDYYDLTDEINPNPGRYVPDYWEMPPNDDGPEMSEEEREEWERWLDELDRKAAWHNGTL